MKYTIEDTGEGFRLTTQVNAGPVRTYDEPGSHGPLAALYVHAEQVGEQQHARRRAGGES